MASRSPVTLVRAKTYLAPDGTSQPVKGSVEHFYHFLLGYLLPVVAHHIDKPLEHLLLQDCGPIMTTILRSVMGEMSVSFEVGDFKAREPKVYLPPWDHGVQDIVHFGRAVDSLRKIAWQKLDCCGTGGFRSVNLLLKRAESLPFYRTGGGAEIPGYGVGRRSIRNIDSLSRWLKYAGVDFQLYVPGNHSIWCQIRTFQGANAISGIRGAEWANVAWCSQRPMLRIIDPVKTGQLVGFLKSLDADFELRSATQKRPRDSFFQLLWFFLGRRRLFSQRTVFP